MKNLVVIVRQTNVAKTFCIANCFTSFTRLHQNVPPMSPLTFAHRIVLGFISQKGKICGRLVVVVWFMNFQNTQGVKNQERFKKWIKQNAWSSYAFVHIKKIGAKSPFAFLWDISDEKSAFFCFCLILSWHPMLQSKEKPTWGEWMVNGFDFTR